MPTAWTSPAGRLALPSPDAVASFGGRFVLNDGGETPDVQHTIHSFPGTKGTMTSTRAGFWVVPEVWTGTAANAKTPAMAPMSESGGNLDSLHIDNFLACLKSRQRPNADSEEGQRTAVMCQLGNAALRTGLSCAGLAE